MLSSKIMKLRGSLCTFPIRMKLDVISTHHHMKNIVIVPSDPRYLLIFPFLDVGYVCTSGVSEKKTNLSFTYKRQLTILWKSKFFQQFKFFGYLNFFIQNFPRLEFLMNCLFLPFIQAQCVLPFSYKMQIYSTLIQTILRI